MHLNFADQYQRGSSLLHRLDPRTKLIGAVAFIAAATILPPGSWLSYALLLAGIVAAAWASGLGIGYALRRSFIALPFALAAVTLPFTVPGPAIGHLGGWTISATGAIRFLSILVKSWISVQAAILLAVTTPFTDLLWGMRELRVPKPLVSIVGFMYRYLFVLGDEALRLMRGPGRARGGSGGRRARRGQPGLARPGGGRHGGQFGDAGV